MGFVYGSTFRLDDKGEIVLTPNGDVSLVTEYQKVAQDLTVLLRSQKNQYLFNLNYGVDYKQYLTDNVLSTFLNKDVVPSITNYYFTEKVNSVNAHKEGNWLHIDADIILKNGDNITITLVI